jgi:hypothetical protein
MMNLHPTLPAPLLSKRLHIPSPHFSSAKILVTTEDFNQSMNFSCYDKRPEVPGPEEYNLFVSEERSRMTVFMKLFKAIDGSKTFLL